MGNSTGKEREYSMEEYEKIQLPWSDWKIIKYLDGSADTKVYEIERNVSEKLEKGALKIISGSASEVESYVQQFRVMMNSQLFLTKMEWEGMFLSEWNF